MKIVHIMLAGPVTDGWNYQDNLITKYQKKEGFDVSIITSRWIYDEKGNLVKCSDIEYTNEDGVKVYRLDIKHDKPFQSKFKRYKNLDHMLSKLLPDILFIHNVIFADMPVLAKYAKQHSNLKVYVDNHSDYSNSGKNWISITVLHKIIWRHMAWLIEPYTRKYYGVLPARVNWLKEVYRLPESKCELLVMGADDEKVERAGNKNNVQLIRQQYGIKDNDFLIVTGGKIDEAKLQVLLLMEVVQQIENKSIKLLIFGSVDTMVYERFISLVDGNKIQYVGWIDAEKTYKYFAASELAVFPGRHSVFWEQVVAQGIPMVCKYWEGTTHIDIGGNVRFIREDTIDCIKNIIKNITENDQEYQKMKSAANKKEREMFLYSNIAKKSLEIS